MEEGSVLRRQSFETTNSFYRQTVDMCCEGPNLRIVRAFALVDST
jgi:hypothetical protein